MIRNIELRDIPTIIGASKNPSPWELWSILAGTISESNDPPASAFWRRELRSSIITGLQTRYKATLTPLPPMNEPASPVDISGAINISKAGTLPLDPENPSKLLLIRQVAADALAFKWMNSGQVVAPLDEIARAHIYMMSYLQPRCAIYLLVAGGVEEHIVEIDYDQAFAQEILNQINGFRQSVEDNEEPAPDYAIDLKALESRYRPTDPEPLDLTDQPGVAAIVSQYLDIAKRKKEADRLSNDLKKQVEEARAKIKKILGNHQVALIAPGLSLKCNEISISARQQDAYSYQKLVVVTTPAAAESNARTPLEKAA